MKYQVIKYKDMCKILKDNGYQMNRKKGDHTIFTKDGKNHISINLKLNPMVARRLIKENDLVLE